jgi:hypothetical protein
VGLTSATSSGVGFALVAKRTLSAVSRRESEPKASATVSPRRRVRSGLSPASRNASSLSVFHGAAVNVPGVGCVERCVVVGCVALRGVWLLSVAFKNVWLWGVKTR